jgi:3',5'-cyclic AMP phosphodiesterase CpdA
MTTIAQISDLHFGRHSVEVTESLLASLAANRPDLVVVSGDLTQRARPSEFAEARRFLNRIEPPKLVVPGNHDVPLYNLTDRLLRPLRNYNRYIGPLDQPAGFYNDGKLAVLGLNTSRRFSRKNGRISLEQIESIKQLFASVPPHAFKTVVTHHPFATSAGEADLELAGRSALALRALAASGVKLLMSGHHHVASSGNRIEMTTRSSMLIVHAGTAISTRLRGGEGNSYNLVRIDPQLVTVRVLEWRGDRGFEVRKVSQHAFDDGVGQPD